MQPIVPDHFNAGAYNGNGVRPQGIITAYDTSVVIAIQPQVANAASYRTDCDIKQSI